MGTSPEITRFLKFRRPEDKQSNEESIIIYDEPKNKQEWLDKYPQVEKLLRKIEMDVITLGYIYGLSIQELPAWIHELKLVRCDGKILKFEIVFSDPNNPDFEINFIMNVSENGSATDEYSLTIEKSNLEIQDEESEINQDDAEDEMTRLINNMIESEDQANKQNLRDAVFRGVDYFEYVKINWNSSMELIINPNIDQNSTIDNQIHFLINFLKKVDESLLLISPK